MSVNIRSYSERSIIVYGEETKDIKELLMELKGVYNRFLTDPIDKSKKIKGWIFSASKRATVIDAFLMKDIDYVEVDKKSEKKKAEVE